MSHIHWFPGHIAKAQKKLKDKLSLVDVVLEVLDARIPFSSAYGDTNTLCNNKPRIVLLNKSDLSDQTQTKKWQEHIKKTQKCHCILTKPGSQQDTNLIVAKILELSTSVTAARLERGLLPRPIRVMVVGMPNVGKSSTINRLIKKAKTKVGAKAGVTRQQQWVRVHDKIELLDTPGIIPMAQDDQMVALKLAVVNSIGENAYDNEYVSTELLKLLEKHYANRVREYYKLEETDELTLDNIANRRNWIVQNAQPDITRTAQFVLLNFREGKIGKVTLDAIEEYANETL